MRATKPLKDRIESNSIPEPNTGCWLWLGATDRHGYGQVTLCRTDRIKLNLRALQAAHRVSWLCTHGPIPNGMCVLHKCDNPACVNLDHLWLGTLKDNSRDMVAKGRHGGGVAPRRADDAVVGATYIARTNRWQAQFSGRYLGLFKTQAEATAAYWTARNASS